MSETEFCVCNRRLTRDISKQLKSGTGCKVCRKKFNPDLSASCYFPSSKEDQEQHSTEPKTPRTEHSEETTSTGNNNSSTQGNTEENAATLNNNQLRDQYDFDYFPSHSDPYDLGGGNLVNNLVRTDTFSPNIAME